jgi:broad specificity phosphatase PhoE
LTEPITTTLYLIRHGATEANLANPPRLQGRRHNPPLARLGIRQAELTRDYLAACTIDVCYSSPMLRAAQTASILMGPHGLKPILLDELTECDVGKWEGMDWQQIRYLDADAYQSFMADPGGFAYRGGESFADVSRRATTCLNGLLRIHEGKTILAVAHHVVNRTYLASLMGLEPGAARQMSLANCGICVVKRVDDKISIATLNATAHLQTIAA